MDDDFLRALFCPYCGSQIETEMIKSEDDRGITNAIVKCECSKYPIIEGILILKKDNRTRNSVRLLERNEVSGALNTLFEAKPNSRTIGGVISIFDRVQVSSLNKISLIYKKIVNRPLLNMYTLKNNGLTFFEVLDALKWGDWGNYLKYRFSSPSFLAALPLLRLISQANDRILDVGSGAGHFSFAISKYVAEEKIVCIDTHFVNLFLAKELFVRRAKLICLDANFVLPFRSNFFSSVFSLDVFHYITSKYQLAKEFNRILNKDGVIILPHLHNSLGFNTVPGEPLTPLGYARLFSDLEVKLIPEEKIIEDFLYNDELNLAKNFSETQLNTSDTITLVASKNAELFRVYKNLSEEFIKYTNNLIINPLYKIEEKGDNVSLTLTFPSKAYETEFSAIKRHMPSSVLIRKDLLKSIRNEKVTTEELEIIHALMKKSILIDVPENYK